MKKIICFLLLTSFFSYGQTPDPNIEKLITAFSKDKNSYIKQVITQTLIVNSSTKANFGGGNTRSAIKINLPLGTKTWFYRITLMDVNQSFTYADADSFYSVLKDKKPFTVNNLTQNGIDFYIIDNNSVQNFLTNGNNNFVFYDSKIKTIGFINSSNLVSNNLWIGIRNPNLRDGMKAIVEVVAMGYY